MYKMDNMRKTLIANAVKTLLLLLLLFRLADVIVMIVTMGTLDMGAVLRGIEPGFRSIVYSDLSKGSVVVFNCILVITILCLPFGFFVLSDKRKQNITGFIACIIAVSLDVLSMILFTGSQTADLLVPLMLNLLMFVCLIIYGKLYILKSPESSEHSATETF